MASVSNLASHSSAQQGQSNSPAHADARRLAIPFGADSLCAECRDLCKNEMHTGLYLVRATSLKRRLEEAADSTAKKLLDQIQTMARDSNDRICENYTRMAAGIGVVCFQTVSIQADLRMLET